MPLLKLPQVEKCCGCVTDLKTAAAIIAVLGIVTSPAVSWAVVRHSYVIRVSCFITVSESRPDIVDINLNNILSFGFGANAGLGPSCLGPSMNKTSSANDTNLRAKIDPGSSVFVVLVKYVGWFVLLADVIFLFASIYFLYRLFHGPGDFKASQYFMWTAILSIVLSFLYGMLYVTACISVGGAFPIFEFAFSFVDILLWVIWLYFIIVINSYIRIQKKAHIDTALAKTTLFGGTLSWLEYVYWLLEYVGVDLLFNSSSFLQNQLSRGTTGIEMNLVGGTKKKLRD